MDNSYRVMGPGLTLDELRGLPERTRVTATFEDGRTAVYLLYPDAGSTWLVSEHIKDADRYDRPSRVACQDPVESIMWNRVGFTLADDDTHLDTRSNEDVE